MGMTLYFKRAKCFVVSDEGTKKFLAQPGPSPMNNVPFWVADTPTFKQGIKDGSIVNLTPPHLMPGYKYPAVEEVLVEDAVDEPAEQSEVPQAPFGAQPMTPVAPLPKIGRVSAGAGKGR